MIIAVIPARIGSKRIPKKNIKFFNGRPIISYSIEAAISSKLFDKVIVSTDDDEISEIAKHYGADVPFLRPSDLSDDFTGIKEVIRHSIKWMDDQNWKVFSICCIYATAPLIDPADLIEADLLFNTSQWDFVIAASAYSYPVQRSFRLQNFGGLKMLFPNNINKRSQDFETVYHDAGHFCWGNIEAWIDDRIIVSERSTIVKIPFYRGIDIDTNDDWIRAELIYKILIDK